MLEPVHIPADDSNIMSHIRARAGGVSRRDHIFIVGIGSAVAFLLLPLLKNLGVISQLQQIGVPFLLVLLFLIITTPLGLLILSYTLLMLPLHHHSASEFSRYAVVGVFNTALNIFIFNSLILISGISQGPLVTVFAIITFAIVISQAFFWNALWTFHHVPVQNRVRLYSRFLMVTTITACVNITIIHVVVNVIGAPKGFPPALWANVALLFTIVTAIGGNFLGYKFLVFAK